MPLSLLFFGWLALLIGYDRMKPWDRPGNAVQKAGDRIKLENDMEFQRSSMERVHQ